MLNLLVSLLALGFNLTKVGKQHFFPAPGVGKNSIWWDLIGGKILKFEGSSNQRVTYIAEELIGIFLQFCADEHRLLRLTCPEKSRIVW